MDEPKVRLGRTDDAPLVGVGDTVWDPDQDDGWPREIRRVVVGEDGMVRLDLLGNGTDLEHPCGLCASEADWSATRAAYLSEGADNIEVEIADMRQEAAELAAQANLLGGRKHW